jgi:hypothetical protein
MKTFWAVGIMMMAAMSARAEECKVIVYVHADSEHREMVYQAQFVTGEMFREIGVEVHWRSGQVRTKAGENSCGAPLEVQADASAPLNKFPSDALAYAAPSANSGVCIHLFMDRITSNRSKAWAKTVTAHVLAHEITHVLEGVCRHSEDGVLKAHWTYADFQQMKNRPLPFAQEDVDLIRMGIANRIQMAAQRAVTE